MNTNPLYLKTIDYFKSGDKFDLLLNKEGDMLITSPQPEPEKLASYYESNNYISHKDDTKGLIALLYRSIKKRSLKTKVKLIEYQLKRKGSLLDVGAGTGEFCIEALKNNWEVEGIEPNNEAIALAKKKGVIMYASINDIENRTFDVITLWHVLEHLPNLDESIIKLTNLLSPNGILIIAVPNFNSFDAKYYKTFWAAYDVPRHLWHFSRKSISRIFKTNFDLEKTKPMWFDSFYVSLLSEKYKSGKEFSLKALVVGFISNLRALCSKEFSSVIYCLRKR